MTTPTSLTSPAARVLLLGDEQRQLEVRAAVLQHFWSIATSTLELSALPIHAADVIVLCHTIPEPQRQTLVTRIRHDAPEILLVKMNGYDSGPHLGADATVDLAHGPAALVSTIYELLTERGLPSREWPLVAEFEPAAGVH